MVPNGNRIYSDRVHEQIFVLEELYGFSILPNTQENVTNIYKMLRIRCHVWTSLYKSRITIPQEGLSANRPFSNRFKGGSCMWRPIQTSLNMWRGFLYWEAREARGSLYGIRPGAKAGGVQVWWREGGCEQTDTTENITFPHSIAGGKHLNYIPQRSFLSLPHFCLCNFIACYQPYLTCNTHPWM